MTTERLEMTQMRRLTTDEIESNFVCFPRALQDFYFAGILKLDELLVLVWIWIGANPVNGKLHTSIDGLVAELEQKYARNRMNKILLSLKKMGLIDYPKIQGKRSPFYIRSMYYRLSSKAFVMSFKKDAGAMEVGTAGDDGRTQADVPSMKEGILKPVLGQGEQKNAVRGYADITNSNNKNDTDTETDNIDSKSYGVGVDSFKATSFEEGECLMIARELGEKNMGFILFALRKRGLPRLMAYMEIMRESKPGVIKDRGAYFNRLVMTDGQLSDKNALSENPKKEGPP